MDEAVDDTEWLRELSVTDKGKIESTIDNVCIILRHDLELKDCYYYDEFKDRMTICGDLPWQSFESRRPASSLSRQPSETLDSNDCQGRSPHIVMRTRRAAFCVTLLIWCVSTFTVN